MAPFSTVQQELSEDNRARLTGGLPLIVYKVN